MKITSDHWLARVRRAHSPNADARPEPAGIELVVVHGISLPPGEFGGGHVEALFTNRLDPAVHPDFESLRGLRVSAHLFIDRRGHLVQFVPFDRRAWHAGISEWRGRPGCNDFGIGIELEGTDTTPYTAAQYTALARIVRTLFDRYPRLCRDAVVGHAEIAAGRKSDPGAAFDWQRLYALIA